MTRGTKANARARLLGGHEARDYEAPFMRRETLAERHARHVARAGLPETDPRGTPLLALRFAATPLPCYVRQTGVKPEGKR